MKTERLTILVTPTQKKSISTRAKALNISTGEVMRRAVERYDQTFSNGEEQALATMADALRRSAKDAHRALRAALVETEKTLTRFRAKYGANDV